MGIGSDDLKIAMGTEPDQCIVCSPGGMAAAFNRTNSELCGDVTNALTEISTCIHEMIYFIGVIGGRIQWFPSLPFQMTDMTVTKRQIETSSGLSEGGSSADQSNTFAWFL